jgi:LacI family transcriptional regulator, galactose operon repressor
MVANPRRTTPSVPLVGTAKAVAERAGVSVTTVSRVLNGHVDVIPQHTQDRVLEAARALGYRPNSLAVALRKGVTQTIGLVVPDIGDAYFHQVARGVEDVAQSAGYGVILTNTDRIPERERSCVNMLLDKRVDGLIFAGGGIDNDRHLVEQAWGTTRVVTIGPHSLPFPSVLVDDSAAIATAVHHLAEVGCRRLLCLAGQPNWLVSQRRLDGYRRAVLEAGLEEDDELILYGEFSRGSAETRVRDALTRGLVFDGIVAFNDYCAIGALQALAASELTVPDDVAVVGCDDIAVSELVQPALTSISFSQYELGRAAAEFLLAPPTDAAENVVMYPHRLTLRESTDRHRATRQK